MIFLCACFLCPQAEGCRNNRPNNQKTTTPRLELVRIGGQRSCQLLQPPKFASKSKPKPAAHTVAGQKQSLERALKQAAASIEKPREKPRKKPREKPREEFESEFESEPETEPESDQSSVSSLDSVEEMASEVSSESFVIIRPTRGCLTCFSFCRSHHFASSVTFRFVRAVLMTDESSSSS